MIAWAIEPFHAFARSINSGFSEHSSRCGDNACLLSIYEKGHEVMKQAVLLSFGAGLAFGAAALAGPAQAAPIPPIRVDAMTVPAANFEPAVVSQDEVDQIKPIPVRWHHHHWHHRHWHRGWHRGWHHHHRHHRHW